MLWGMGIWGVRDALEVSNGKCRLKKEVPKRVAAFGAFTFNMICHSKGGLWGREYLHQHMRSQELSVGTFLTLATPHYGSVLADYVNAFYLGSQIQKSKKDKTSHTVVLNTTGGPLPAGFMEVRDIYWPKDYDKVFSDPELWNPSYSDLGPKAVGAWAKKNAPFIMKYKNCDNTSPNYWAYVADAQWDRKPHITRREYTPLQKTFFSKARLLPLPHRQGVKFFNHMYDALGRVHRFDFTDKLGGKPFGSILIPKVFWHAGSGRLKNDLFVTERSGTGAPHSPNLSLPVLRFNVKYWRHAGLQNHATIASEACGDEVISSNRIAPLR